MEEQFLGLTVLNILDMDSSSGDEETILVFKFLTLAVGKTIA